MSAIKREFSSKLCAKLEDDRWAVNAIGLIVPLGRSDLLRRLHESEIFQEMMEGICNDVAAEVQANLDQIEEKQAEIDDILAEINRMKDWLGLPNVF